MSDDEATLRAMGLGDEDALAWRESGLPAERFDAWLIDRVARRPAGTHARQVYGAADVHDFARRAILENLALDADDHFLEIGCGGGLLLREAQGQGARAVGIDHSHEMAILAKDRAPTAQLIEAKAEQLPFQKAVFTAIAMSVVFIFLDDPMRVLTECRRVMRSGGRIAVYTTAPELRGTPAAPEPVASLAHFYSDDELVNLGESAALQHVAVIRDGGGQLLIGRKLTS